jgi:predicted transcriptional regulator
VKRGLHIEALDALGDANRRAIVEILSGRERGGDESSRRER